MDSPLQRSWEFRVLWLQSWQICSSRDFVMSRVLYARWPVTFKFWRLQSTNFNSCFRLSPDHHPLVQFMHQKTVFQNDVMQKSQPAYSKSKPARNLKRKAIPSELETLEEQGTVPVEDNPPKKPRTSRKGKSKEKQKEDVIWPEYFHSVGLFLLHH